MFISASYAYFILFIVDYIREIAFLLYRLFETFSAIFVVVEEKAPIPVNLFVNLASISLRKEESIDSVNLLSERHDKSAFIDYFYVTFAPQVHYMSILAFYTYS